MLTPGVSSSCVVVAASLLLLTPAVAVAQTPVAQRNAGVFIEHRIFPDRTYDPAVPAPTRSLGYALGEQLATYAELGPYLERLAASSDRVTFGTHGESYERRPIHHLTISAPENLARLAEIRANLARLADPRGLSGPDEAESIIRSTPIVVMLVFGTDGAETAGPEAALQVAYQLAAATDARTVAALKHAVVIIVPAENPDSNQRTVAWYNAFRVGPQGTADPDAAEHQFPWGINSNNRYQIDPNRESVWSTLRETRAMVALYRHWNPQVFVDNHGEHAQYTGPWYVEPLHEVLTARQQEWHRRFGEAMQPEFARRGYVYHPWEYGQFDPGYWDTYPNFSGAIAWTTETTGGGSRGLRVERRNGAPYTLADGIIQHILASDITVSLAAENRERLLRDFLAYKQSAIAEGERGPVRAYALSAHNDPARLATVVNTLRRNAIDVQRTTREVRVPGARAYFEAGATGRPAPRDITLPPGSYVITTAQPESRMLRVLMEYEARMSEAFLAQIAKARAAADTGRAAARMFYDITAWSMPHTYHLTAYELPDAIAATALEHVGQEVTVRGTVTRPDARHAFVIDYGSNAALRALAQLRRDSVRYRIVPEPFTVDGSRFTAGSIAVLRQDNPNRDLAALARSLAEASGTSVTGVDSPATEAGLRLEPDRLVPASPGRIAVVMDRPVSTQGYGHIWFTFEQLYGVDFTALNFDRLLGIDLNRYDVLILPDGNYGSVHAGVAGEVAAKLRAWVERGGRLIALRGAAAWLAKEEYGITAARLRPPGGGTAQARMPAIPGAVLRAVIADPKQPLTWGYTDGELPVMVWSALAFEAGAPATAPVRIADAERARVSGFVFPESLAHVAGSPYLIHERRGTGSVVLFLDDPNFRLFWDGLTRLFFNAVLQPRLN